LWLTARDPQNGGLSLLISPAVPLAFRAFSLIMGLLQRVWRREEIARKTLANTLITLRNAQVRRISWVRGVRPARGGASGLLMTPFPAGHHSLPDPSRHGRVMAGLVPATMSDLEHP